MAGDFDPNDPLTYNAATSVTVYDSLGDSHVMTYFFLKDNDPTATTANNHSFTTNRRREASYMYCLSVTGI